MKNKKHLVVGEFCFTNANYVDRHKDWARNQTHHALKNIFMCPHDKNPQFFEEQVGDAVIGWGRVLRTRITKILHIVAAGG